MNKCYLRFISLVLFIIKKDYYKIIIVLEDELINDMLIQVYLC